MGSEVKRLHSHYLIAKILDAPLWAMIAYLPFILAKELHSSQSTITLAMTLKPLLAVGSFYLGACVCFGSANLARSILWSSCLGRLPFLFFPFIHNVWFYLFAFAVYALTDRAIIPPWMELMKSHIHVGSHTKAVADGALFRFLTPILFSFGLAAWMDYNHNWQWLFVLCSILSLVGLIPFAYNPVYHWRPAASEQSSPKPLKTSLQLLKTRRDFAFFQGVFFFGGIGIMMYQPLLPKYSMEFLDIDYKQLGLAIAVCKGVGFALTGRIWARLIKHKSIFALAATVALFAAITPLMIGIADQNLYLFYAAYLVYGAMQGGSEPVWQLSGPLFAGRDHSGPYTNTNLLMVGLRGLFAPTLGALLGYLLGVKLALFGSALVCLLGALWGAAGARLYRFKVAA